MQTAEVLLGLGSGLALSLGLGLLLARVLWSGLLRVMCAMLGRARRTPVPAGQPNALATGGRAAWNPNLGRAPAR